MEQLISLLIALIIFCIVGYGLYWVCVKFQLPQPVMWICGAILLIIILLWVAGQIGAVGPFFPLRR